MRAVMLLPCLALLVCVRAAVTGPEARSSSANSKDQQLATAGVGVLDSVLRGKSRQSRCVRCYEDRDRDRYYGGYSSRTGDDMRSSAWYYSGYDDRSSSRGGDRDYDRYYDRYRNYYDDRYSPRTYDRYEGRGYDDYRRGSYGGSGAYDRDRGYGYDNRERDRYYGDRYNEGSSRDRYYDRSRSNYDRYDPYDRYYSRYDFRNYRPWDETYSSSYGGRPRPLGVSYLLERDSDAASDGPGNTANPAGNGGSGISGVGSGGQSMPVPAAQTAAEGSTGKAAEQ
ncbi:RNA-binding motif protein, X-linked-like-2 isoform X5 [Drosophila serrata]|uniref:RNA-binding motif protein, X-linked-like-2 isoform X5 n=1 Tax=Drosophila serrata TaxID=7274 RepID=UPI000A1CF936|nr:RNA-binding motif protein, X-linked-like-2 isoform X5 [Drosophila serrata]